MSSALFGIFKVVCRALQRFKIFFTLHINRASERIAVPICERVS